MLGTCNSWTCVLVGNSWNTTGRNAHWEQPIQSKDELASGKDRIFWTSTVVLLGAQVVSELDNTQQSAEQELSKKWWTMVMHQFGHRKKLCKSQITV